MGIQGLIPFLKKSTREANIKEFKGGVVAIDSYCWLHKGAFACAEKLALGEKTDQYVYYCMKYVNSLLSFDIKPVMVFDGCRLPSKKEVEQTRRDRRNANRKKAAQLLREGKRAEARDCLVQCVDITPEMALELMNACREKGVDCIVAPYEADAQLAYLNKIGLVDVIITEDSDLVLFGCKKIMFKMDVNGNGLLVEKSKLQHSVDMPQDQFTFEKFRRICILSGCDYLQSLPGIGLAKATKVLKLSRQSDMRQVIRKIPSTLKMSSLNVPDDYADNFNKAENTFLYQLVFDPLLRKAVPLNPYPPGIDPSDLQYAGPSLSDEMAFQIAIGNVNVNTLKRMASFDPDTFKPKSNGFNQNVNEIMRQSIWSVNCSEFLKERRKKLQSTEDSAMHPPEERPVQRSSTKGKEVTITVPAHGRRSNNHLGKTEQLINEDVSLPCEDELVKMYAAGGLVNSSVEDLSDLDKVAKIQPGNNGMAVPSKAVPELAEEKAGKSTLETEHDRKNKPSNEAKTPRRNGGPHSDSFVSPSKRNNVFAMRSEERNGSDKKRFSLDGCPGTPKTENKCRFFDLSPEPVRESRFFVKLKQMDKACDDAVAKDETDIVDVDSDAELKSDVGKPQEGSGKSEVRSRLSAFASRYRRGDNPVCSSATRATLGSSKRSLFSLDKSGDSDSLADQLELESVPKKLKLDALFARSEQNQSRGTPSARGSRRSIFAVSGTNEDAVGKDDRPLVVRETIPVTPNTERRVRDCEPEDPLTDITAKEISCLNRKANDKASPASLSDEDPLSHMTGDGSDKKNRRSRRSVFSLNDDFYEEERVLSDEGEAEDPLLPVRRSMLENGSKANNNKNTSRNQGKKKESSKGCRPSGLSRGRGRPRSNNSLQQDDSAFKQSSLSNFFRSNFALDKNVERFPPK